MRGVLAVLSVAVLVAGSAQAEKQKVTAGFAALDYNSFSSDYVEVPTFVTLVTTRKGGDVMEVEYDPFGRDEYGIDTEFTRFRREAVPEYRAFLAKFLQWEAVAREDGDQFDKEIGRAAGVRGKLKFEFRSASASTHLLAVDFCTIGMCLDHPMLLNRQGAEGLDAALASFAERGVQPVDIDGKYQ